MRFVRGGAGHGWQFSKSPDFELFEATGIKTVLLYPCRANFQKNPLTEEYCKDWNL